MTIRVSSKNEVRDKVSQPMEQGSGKIRKEMMRGIKTIQEDFPFLPSTALGIIFNFGSRDEEIPGMTHFIEHTLFKGTRKKTAREISLTAESLGAHIDGFTTREATGLYARCLKDKTKEVLALLFEIVASPLFLEGEVEKEKRVVFQEIREIEEDPEDKVFSILYEGIFPNHPLGQKITGTFETVKGFSREKILNYFQSSYTKERVLLFSIGNFLPTDLSFLSSLNNSSAFLRKREKPNFPQKMVRVERRKELESVYIVIAQPIFVSPHNRYALSVLNTAFGGSLSSRLFQRLREEEGLVYQISSFFDFYSDCALFGIYFVTSQKFSQKALRIIYEVRERCYKDLFSPKEFEVALNLTKSSVILSQESPLHRMFALAKSELLFGETLTLEEVLTNYEKVRLEEVNFLVREVLMPPLVIAAVGSLKEKELESFL
ncbi:MAG: pitrilysin family protein [candidate division WOR-3 bacterium]